MGSEETINPHKDYKCPGCGYDFLWAKRQLESEKAKNSKYDAIRIEDGLVAYLQSKIKMEEEATKKRQEIAVQYCMKIADLEAKNAVLVKEMVRVNSDWDRFVDVCKKDLAALEKRNRILEEKLKLWDSYYLMDQTGRQYTASEERQRIIAKKKT